VRRMPGPEHEGVSRGVSAEAESMSRGAAEMPAQRRVSGVR